MIVVSNTSPLTNLAAIGHFDLLRKLFGEIHIAHGVWATLRGHPGTEIAVQIPAAYHLHGGIAMRTTLNLDDEALTSALKTSPGKTKT
ncbi:MAG TPA: hypothetical protein VLV54_10900, partial [Thermoanaerobaculia bacterium]|nr:hypothetical protein [Thermoanaerobaculia bacterium]